MRDRCLQLVSRQRFELNSFESKEMVNLIGEVFTFCDLNPAGVSDILPSARTLRRHMETDAVKIQDLLVEHGDKQAKDGVLFLALDHKTLTNKTGDEPNSALGCLLTLKRPSDKMVSYLLGFTATDDKSDRNTEDLTWEILKVSKLEVFYYINNFCVFNRSTTNHECYFY
jgi:hypothetical protein